jgi:hypothetical protein
VRSRPLAAIRSESVLLVEATCPAVLLAYPAREETVPGCAGMNDRRLHQGLRNARSRDVLGHVEAAELRGPGGDIAVWAPQYVCLANDSASALGDEHDCACWELTEPLGEIGGGLLHGQGIQFRLWQEVAVAPSAGSHAHLCDGSSIAWRSFANDDLAGHGRSVPGREISNGPE